MRTGNAARLRRLSLVFTELNPKRIEVDKLRRIAEYWKVLLITAHPRAGPLSVALITAQSGVHSALMRILEAAFGSNGSADLSVCAGRRAPSGCLTMWRVTSAMTDPWVYDAEIEAMVL